MGGTTAKCALVEDGRFAVDSVYYAAGYVHGFPIKSPVDRHRRGRLGRRLDRLARRTEPPARRAAERGLDAGPGLLRPRRHGRPPSPTPTSCSAGSIREQFLGGELTLSTDAGDAARWPQRNRDAARLSRRATVSSRWPTASRDRHRHDGRRDPARLGRARPRSARLRAVQLRRRRAAARLGAGARALDPDRDRSARARHFLRHRHAAGRRAARRRKTFAGLLDDRDASRRSSSIFAPWNRKQADGVETRVRRQRSVLRALRRDALSRAAPQHQGADHAACATRPRSAPRSSATTSGATAMPTAKAPAEFQALHFSAFARLDGPTSRACRAGRRAARADDQRARSISARRAAW